MEAVVVVATSGIRTAGSTEVAAVVVGTPLLIRATEAAGTGAAAAAAELQEEEAVAAVGTGAAPVRAIRAGEGRGGEIDERTHKADGSSVM